MLCVLVCQIHQFLDREVDFFMQTVRKTQRKVSRSTQNIKRFKQTEQKMTLFEMFVRFMTYKQTEGLAKSTIRGYYEYFHYLNDYLDWGCSYFAH
jgi:hypothetical protein